MTHDVTLWNEATKQRAWPKIDEQVSELDRQIGVNKLGLRYFARFLPVYQQLPEFIVKKPFAGYSDGHVGDSTPL